MASDIDVLPSPEPGAVAVATDEIGRTHYPIYKQAFGAEGSVTQIDADNPLPIESLGLVDLLRDIRDTNNEILNQLKTMNAHYAEWDGEDHDDN